MIFPFIVVINLYLLLPDGAIETILYIMEMSWVIGIHFSINLFIYATKIFASSIR